MSKKAICIGGPATAWTFRVDASREGAVRIWVEHGDMMEAAGGTLSRGDASMLAAALVDVTGNGESMRDLSVADLVDVRWTAPSGVALSIAEITLAVTVQEAIAIGICINSALQR